MNMETFYTYLWLREDGTPYYVGKGKGNRGFTSDMHKVKCPSDRVRIIVQEWDTERDAFEAEKLLIAIYGRANLGTGCLRNLTDGGDQPPSRKGATHTEEANQKNREAHLGRKGYWTGKKLPQTTLDALLKSRKGKPSPRKGAILSDETRRKISLATKGRPSSFKGKHHTEEAKRKNGEAHLGNTAWNLGIPCSEATKQKISAAHKARWEKRLYGVEFRTNCGHDGVDQEVQLQPSICDR
jgi:hypothetical protein